MSEQAKSPLGMLGDEIRQIVREAVREELKTGRNASVPDRLLEPEKAAEILSVSVDWLYHNAKTLPFTRKLGPKLLRFSYASMVRWMESKKFS